MKRLLSLVLALVAAPLGWGYVDITNSSGQAIVWPAGPIPIQIKVDNSAQLSDGNTRATSLQAAMTDPLRGWNQYINSVQLTPQIAAVGNGTDGNSVNEVFFSNAPYDYGWDKNTLAVTTGWCIGSQRTEGDIIFNTAFTWDSYRGPLKANGVIDIQRVALHELGHVLGLDHPDQHGQSVTALMNSVISDLDSLQSDDILGAQGLYGVGNPTPPAFTQQPSNQSTVVWSTAQFYVVVSGTPTPSLKWQRLPAGGAAWEDLSNTGIYYGTDSAALTVTASTAMDGDQFRCIATNPSGSATSNSATLTVSTPVGPAFTVQPTDQTVNQNQPVTLQVTVIGTPTPTIRWERIPAASNNSSYLTDDGTYSGTFTTSLSFVATAPMNGDRFRCLASNSGGAVESNWAMLIVGAASLPTFTKQPVDQTVTGGQSATISVGVNSSPAGYLQWEYWAPGDDRWRSWTYWMGNTTDTIVFPAGKALNGYQFRCAATNVFGTTYSQPMTLTVSRDTTKILAVAVGGTHTLLIKADHSLWACGDNSYGQLGAGLYSEQDVPVPVTTNVAKITAGYANSYFIKSDGTLWAMGQNESGELGDGSTANRNVPEQIATGVTSVSAGDSFTVLVKSDGTLWGMGSNYGGQFGDGTTTDHHSPVLIATGVRAAVAGSQEMLFVKTDGTLWAAGMNGNGQLGDGTTTDRHTPVWIANGVSSVGCGYDFSMFAKSDGTLWGMGYNSSGQLGDGTATDRHTPVQVASNVAGLAVGWANALFVKTDGSLWITNDNPHGIYPPVHIADQVSAASAGTGAFAFVKTDGSLWMAGDDRYSRLGDGAFVMNTQNPHPTPFELFGPDPVITPPVITVQPVGGNFSAGDQVLLRVDATGNPYPTFQWRKDNINLEGATDPYLHPYPTPGGSGQYTVVATNAGGSVTSQPATISIQLLNAISYISNTFPSVAGAGARVTFSCKVYNGGTNAWGPDHYLWLVDDSGHEIASASMSGIGPGATATVTLMFVAPVTPGAYYWYLQGEQSGTGLFQDRTFVLLNVVANTQASKDDIDGDRVPDLIWQNMATGERTIWLMNNGTYLGSVSLGTVSTDWSIAGTGDFNGDVHTDIVWQNAVSGEREIWLMNGTTIVGAASLGTVPTDWSIAAVGDFNGDGKPDLVWQNTTTGERVIWLMNGTAFLSSVSLGTVPKEWWIAGAGDFSGDGHPDLVWQNLATGECRIWIMNGAYYYNSVTFGTVGPEMRIAGVMDFNGDGGQDILWTNTATGERTVWLMNRVYFASAVSLTTLPPEWALFHPVATPGRVGADFNGDLKSDLVWEDTATGEHYVWLMNGTGFASSVFLGVIPAQWHVAATADFNGDGKPDLVWQNTATGERAIWLMDGTTYLGSVSLGTVPVEWSIAGASDFNGDGKPDLVWENTSTGERYVWLMNGTTFSSSVFFGAVSTDWRIAGAGDFNGDGKADLIWENTSTGERCLWLMNGTSYLSSASLGVVPAEWSIAGTGDFNSDGNCDLVWQNAVTGERVIWLMSGTNFLSSASLGVVATEWSIRN